MHRKPPEDRRNKPVMGLLSEGELVSFKRAAMAEGFATQSSAVRAAILAWIAKLAARSPDR